MSDQESEMSVQSGEPATYGEAVTQEEQYSMLADRLQELEARTESLLYRPMMSPMVFLGYLAVVATLVIPVVSGLTWYTNNAVAALEVGIRSQQQSLEKYLSESSEAFRDFRQSNDDLRDTLRDIQIALAESR